MRRRDSSRPASSTAFSQGNRRLDAQPKAIAEFHDIDAERFRREILTRYEPAVLRGLVLDWPAVQRGRASPEACSEYLNGFDSGRNVDVLMIPPRGKGRIFYSDDKLSGFN